MPAEVVVATADGTPIADAVVRSDPIDPHHPLNFGDYFRDEPATLGIWRTDKAGIATILILSERPTAVSFLAPGYAPDSVVIDSTKPLPLRLYLQPVSPEFRNP